uniref:5-oxoprolinase n=1 Tax=Eucampia antarctica TaxID=49252 RepID=A0A7S2S486_9STRA|mmetsp:Transcript_30539/g.29441  ORF Transcript_30539/g.29441 Transcript_30539/m.29441 type:complete len:1318 (+) Transcript_30539:128-4081(+)|eukprot:CAMPEP_0197827730 /NCGR_PEP_ID=MMETSP1437-20131217/4452_1 /TAXON_ID=49252 ORGANISM="Eucampia antarctica, Strain CCMP1452" /NCGR_SAMPLE_ID=MMETSP1437 /ASSEMBLY_ACC=CAM_ASM_001096 /LENGTH=1317 /DNA_ID=CAMNT_0043428705 /DNA_START=124 /DNA_END=4077 /DNA_ORIENTATION=+
MEGDRKFHFSIDRGGTFTDVHCVLPDGRELVTKLLSEDPDNYPDAPTEGIRRLLQEHDDESGKDYPRKQLVYTGNIGSIRMGTTVATNALLERKGERMGLLITKGFKDLLKIGNQSRPNIFDLTCATPELLYEQVQEVDERVMLANFFDENKSADELAPYITSSNDNPQAQAGRGPRIEGVTKEIVVDLKPPDLDIVKKQLLDLSNAGIQSIAIVLMHSYTYAHHEQMIGDLAKSMGCFTQVSLSSEVMPMVRMVPRGHTACAAAYLTPKITDYLTNFRAGFDEHLNDIRLDFMKSDGGLTPVDDFGGHQAILSGPAGGVIGYAKTAFQKDATNNNSNTSSPQPVIGFDMGGTSTDVSRYDGSLEHVFETTIAGVSIQAPQLDIHTVAAGGGSRLFLKSGMFVVGPESAGAHPGPVCYRKNGHLAVTDANIVLGRVIPEHFPQIFGPNEDQPLHLEGSREAFVSLIQQHQEMKHLTVEELAYGFLKVANEAMCRPIRNLTQMKGYDIATHKLACFGGAGPQHACAMAKALGMSRVFVHRYGGILSAYGLSMADAVREDQEPTAQLYQFADPSKANLEDPSKQNREERLKLLAERAKQALVSQGYSKEQIIVEKYLNLRYQGTDNSIMIQEPEHGLYDTLLPFADAFRNHYQREFGFVLEGRDILIDDYRVRAVILGPTPKHSPAPKSIGAPPISGSTRAYFENGWQNVSFFKTDNLKPGHEIKGPAIVVQSISTIVLEIDCTAYITADGDLDIIVGTDNQSNNEVSKFIVDDVSSSIPKININEKQESDCDEIIMDPIQLSIFSHRFMGIAEQMGRTLARTAISVNMKERLDFSCALFTADGGLVANAPHIPVHLGAMQAAVKFQVDYWNAEGREGIHEGEALVSNHPQLAGGSHLPDITVITPVFHEGKAIFFVASRGHHADIGGIAPGSMPPHSKSLEEEGAMIVAFKLVKEGKFQEEGITEILRSPGSISGNFGTRNLNDNLSDLRAQVAANNSGIRLLQSLVIEYGLNIVEAYMDFIQQNAELAIRNMLIEFTKIHGSRAHAVDYMDDGTKIELTIDIDQFSGDTHFDFTGTGPQVLGNHNAPPAVTYSAVIYSLRSLVGEDIPLNQGCLAPITFTIPKFCLLNPSDDAGVVGGNVLTSQRVVDVVLLAFKACAASQGCMNNLTFGDSKFGYYETIAGGAGAGPSWNGRSGVHTHCTNTRITDPEILERRYPVLLRQFVIRNGSGGNGKFKGGDGVIRELEPLRPLVMSILSERRTLQPYGMDGGEKGQCGQNLLVRKNGVIVNIGGRCSTSIDVGERLRIQTPGGGGCGSPN